MTIDSAGTKGFLFCDLRGYSAFVEANGDRAAADLLDTYRTHVRSAIAAHAGAEIRTEGDSVYVVFPAASGAVEAGLALVAAAAEASTKALPIRVGVGIHAGETVATTEGLVGGAVNIAARVCAKARAGEVLVTDTVRALTRTFLPYTYTGLGTQHLKGIAGGIPLYRVEAVPSSRGARLRRQLGARRGRVLVIVGLVGIILAGATGVYAVNRPPDCIALPASTADVVARIDPTRTCVVQTIAVGSRPNSIVATDTSLWIANEQDWTVTRIGLATRSTAHWYGTPGSPIALAAHLDGQVDVLGLDDRPELLQKLLPQRLFIIFEDPSKPIFAPQLPELRNPVYSNTGYSGMAASNAWTWIVSGNGSVIRVSPRTDTGQFSRSVIGIVQADLPGLGVADTGSLLVAASGGTAWVAYQEAPVLLRFDGPVTMPTVLTLAGARGTLGMAATPTELWLLRQDGSLTRIDAGSGNQQTVALDAPATGLAVGPESLWLLDDVARTVRSVDPKTGHTIGTLKVGGILGSGVFADGFLWVTVHAP